MEKGKKRVALLVGCNYPGTQYELHGCINDVVSMRNTLVSRFEFEPENIKLMIDAPVGEDGGGSKIMPTGSNIMKELGDMADQAEDGDVLFFHYSGHGTLIPSVKPVNPFRKDEAIVPCDFILITDVDFRHIVNRLPKGASFTILSDSCHSGGLIDKEKEQIGPSSLSHDNIDQTRTISPSFKPKTIPFETILQHLTNMTNINTSDVATHMLQLFGANASLKFRLPWIELEFPDLLKSDEGILLSGCQANETSADMNPVTGGGKAYGAFSNAVEMVLKENSGKLLSNKEVVMMARKVLKAKGIEQHPCLYCSDENANAPFLWQQESSS
ncbi:hypothetical protein UlMin_006593 [Ulmus minor]